ncbi:MAG: 2OG-Fe(II) oxygenase, partial [Verrucomicrobiota bacterium]|nr:2OG-Fe(II) oxygenase [Verrucomicrobiota bacterium]
MLRFAPRGTVASVAALTYKRLVPDVPVRIEYNQDLKPLEELLRGVKRPGDFCVSGALELPMPRLEIQGAGVISFPVPEEQARRIIAAAERAPYGRGAETILDTSVRKVWQLAPAKVRLGGKSWSDSFGQILAKVKAGLGCGEAAVKAELYKLLVYDEGGFFLPHRDTEKEDGMFGTLVVSLPSAHRGGELIVRHAGREAAVDLSKAEFSEIGFVAFYADCEHEVRPIIEGHRVCLVYNLILERPPKRGSRPLQAPDYEAETARTAGLLETALKHEPVKIAWLLEHQYSPAGLSFAGLKNADAARAQVLCKAAARAGCVAHLAIVHIEESGIAEPEYDGGYRGRSRWLNDSEDDDDDAEGEDFEVVEVCDWNHFLDEWVAPDDRRMDFGEVPIEPGELLPDAALDGEKPDEQRLMEASRNEGASFER